MKQISWKVKSIDKKQIQNIITQQFQMNLGKMEFEELYDEQLTYKRTPMDFIDHLWELLSRIKYCLCYRATGKLINPKYFREL